MQPDGTLGVRFDDLRVPMRADQKLVEWTAYAFNDDHVKSETAHAAVSVASGRVPRHGKAYVITIGLTGHIALAETGVSGTRPVCSKSLLIRTRMG